MRFGQHLNERYIFVLEHGDLDRCQTKEERDGGGQRTVCVA